jgi:tetratricopeptide (TPR) repeat protein
VSDPAIKAGHSLDASLIEHLVDQSFGRDGALPLLQFALTRIWQGIADGVDPGEMLVEIGGVGGALAGEAQRIFDGLASNHQDIARRLFLALVHLGEGTRDTRRRTSVRTILARADDQYDVRFVISRFSSTHARLLTVSAEADGSDSIEVTHEALFDHWQLFKEWLDAGREDIRFQRRLDDAAKHWDESHRPDGLLWRPPDLGLLERYHDHSPETLNELQFAFFEASRSLDRNEQQRAQYRVRLYKGASVVFAILVCVASYFGLVARKNETRATSLSDLATKAVDKFAMEVASDPRLERHDLEQLRHNLLSSAGVFYKQIADSSGDDTETQFRRGWAYSQLASITSSIGSLHAAYQCQVTGLVLLRRALESWPTNLDYQYRLADGLSRLGRLHFRFDRYREAEESLQQSVLLVNKLLQAVPTDPKYISISVANCSALGVCYERMGQLDEAQTQFSKGVMLAKQLRQIQSSDEHLNVLCTLYNNRGVLFNTKNMLAEAAKDFREVLSIAKGQTSSNLQLSLGVAEFNLGAVYSKIGNFAEVEPALLAAEDRLVSLTEAHPNVFDYSQKLAYAYTALGIHYMRYHQLEMANNWFQKSVGLTNSLIGKFPSHSGEEGELADLLYERSRLLLQLGELNEAENLLMDAKRIYERELLPPGFNSSIVARLEDSRQLTIGYVSGLALTYSQLGRILAAKSQLKEQEAALFQGLQLWSALVKRYPEYRDFNFQKAVCEKLLANSLHAQKRVNEALEHYQTALSIQDDYVNKYPDMVDFKSELVELRCDLGLAYYDTNRYQRAAEEFRKSIELCKHYEGPDSTINWNRARLTRLHAYQGMAHFAGNDPKSAITAIEEVCRINSECAIGHGMMALILASAADDQFRSGERALGEATKACEIGGQQNWWYLSVLAAARAETGDYEAAMRDNRKATELAPDEAKSYLRNRLSLYQRNLPFRQQFESGSMPAALREHAVVFD